MTLLSFSGFIGRFHPIFVHLPIGILLLGILLHWLSRGQKYANLKPAVSITLILGAVSAVLSCISGWMLAEGAEYNEATLDQHRWMGIAVAIVSIIYYLFYIGKLTIKFSSAVPYIVSLVLFVLITITGHLGGTLTHGEGYLTQELTEISSTQEVKKVIPDVQQAVAYNDIIQPMLQHKCYSCHGSSKQKGKLRLDEKDFIEKGGEDGKVLIAGKSDESELYKRLILEASDKKHMPPKGKPQLTEAEIALMHWWINTGASFDQQVKDLPQDVKIIPLLTALQSNSTAVASKPDIPDAPVAKAPDDIINKLKEAGATVVTVSKESNYLSVNFLSSKKTSDAEMKLLEGIAPQLVWLKAGGTSITDNGLASIAKLTTLTRLSVDYTQITDKGIAQLQSLSKLQYLNIVGTEITTQGIITLKGLPELQQLYFYQSKISNADSAILRQAFPEVILDTGGYVLPLLEGDTSEVKQKPD
ncbi:MAG: hypothetical protein J0I84_18600 [Terrimonas sp.]|nr:hypothetical protein [Terrimonas sp.]OJY99029.1 MAG: hypothetical protein BGP13_23515 [Sphingobacteriales bacterium 40-81]